VDPRRLAEIRDRLPSLSPSQIELVGRIIDALAVPPDFSVAEDSDFATEHFAVIFGDILKVHHLNSTEPFTKDKFEYALVAALSDTGHVAVMLERGNPGADVIIDGVSWSLKTQANAAIRADRIVISKFMELGRGKWETEEDLIGLRAAMFEHMEQYDRIFTLRCLKPRDPVSHIYELVEIPKTLLLLSKNFPCVMAHNSRQTPKPGRCQVQSDSGEKLFDLYFDGGTERKLQIQGLAKSACKVHAAWSFTTEI
jgi:type II restriction enzyme